jgi:N-acetylglucosamine kinase-like BadF-type ATPase
MTRLVIAVDAGGSTTRVRIARDGEIVADAEGRSGAVRPGAALAASLTISETIRGALVKAGLVAAVADVLVVGAAGVGREPERAALAQALRGERIAERVVVTTDVAIAMADAFGEAPGAMLIAGTGSIAIARDAAGQLHRVGGWGWQIGDEGSGAWIGREALRTVLRMRDGRDAASALADAVRAAAKVADDDALVRWGNSVTAAEFALLAPTVLQLAEAGDATAVMLRAGAVAALAELVTQAAHSAQAQDVALSGGLLRQAGLRGALIAALPSLQIRQDTVDPLRGALLLATP